MQKSSRTEMARFIISKSKVLDAYDRIKDLGVKISYSQKTNPLVAEILEDNTDCLFSVHSLKSLDKIKDKSRAWYFAQAWSREELDSLFSLNVNNFVIDNINDLNILTNYLNKNNKKINILLRMKLKENTVFTGKYFVFGMDSRTINEKIIELRSNQNIDKLGIHFHRKTQNVAEWELKEELMDALKPETFEAIDMINIGGGIPAKYKNSNDRAIEVIYDKIKELGIWLESKGIELMAEPGRAIAAPAAVLEADVLNVYDNNIIVDCSIYNGMLDTVVANVKLIVDGELEKGTAQQNYTIKGITPASEDILRYSVYLDNPKVGDKIRFLNAGAYTYTTDFCDLDEIEVVIST